MGMKTPTGNSQGDAGPGNIKDGEEKEQGLFFLFRASRAVSLENTRHRRDAGQERDNSGIRGICSHSRAVPVKEGNFLVPSSHTKTKPGTTELDFRELQHKAAPGLWGNTTSPSHGARG